MEIVKNIAEKILKKVIMMSADTSNKIWNSTETRALKLLGGGHGPEVAATATGVSVSRISQLLSDPEFAAEVSELRFQNLQKHNERDDKYDSMESKLLVTLEDVLPLMMRPMEILKAIQVINAAKRRGQSAPDTVTHQNTVVNLTMPTLIMQQFTTNINNQVIQAGDQTLETIQSGSMLAAAKAKFAALASARSSPVLENGVIQNESHAQGTIGIKAITAG